MMCEFREARFTKEAHPSDRYVKGTLVIHGEVMKSQSKLSSFTRLPITKWLSIALVLSFFLPAATLAKSRSHDSREKTRSFINASAPLATIIEVNTTGDGENLDPSVGCDTEPGIAGDQCSLRAAFNGPAPSMAAAKLRSTTQ